MIDRRVLLGKERRKKEKKKKNVEWKGDCHAARIAVRNKDTWDE